MTITLVLMITLIALILVGQHIDVDTFWAAIIIAIVFFAIASGPK